ncbi:hypothetical protein AA12717_1693 [Gluconacetobacter sacchari DSM 12717]|uniref:Glycosyltransferase subfamily 4-like N-terminal domain-containing protein n=2 Tax=Gluconacetobacter sacchari TaxID=92759 RepID=A0A7W4NNU5_9PROT|nr:hypothetical protein [Gluconacetobacter sacchari]MBB2161204.1 hypothetical protein [Gluconacetobacter sacchari]GBQ24109.1 hypothetical protein AA12717_1693 [Gluconacetobacter sacchari DSM 12717]
MIDGRAPDRGRDAGSQATLSHMQALRALDYDVSFMASDVVDDLRSSDGRDEAIHWLGAPAYGSVEDLLRLQQDSFDLVYFHRELNATRYLGLARRLQRRARLIYGVADLHGVRVMRQGWIEGRPEFVARGRVLLRDEIRAAQTADVTITHSDAEAALLGRIAGVRATVVPWVVPVGPPGPGYAGRRGRVNRGVARVTRHTRMTSCAGCQRPFPDGIGLGVAVGNPCLAQSLWLIPFSPASGT